MAQGAFGGSLLGAVRALSLGERLLRGRGHPPSGGWNSVACLPALRAWRREAGTASQVLLAGLQRGDHALRRYRHCQVAGVTPPGPGSRRGRPDFGSC